MRQPLTNAVLLILLYKSLAVMTTVTFITFQMSKKSSVFFSTFMFNECKMYGMLFPIHTLKHSPRVPQEEGIMVLCHTIMLRCRVPS